MEMYNKNMLSATELGPQDLFWKWNKDNRNLRTNTADNLAVENQRLMEENKELKGKVQYLTNLVHNKEVQCRKCTINQIRRK